MKNLDVSLVVASLALASCGDNETTTLRGPPMDPMSIPKFTQPLAIPAVMPLADDGTYRIAARQFEQQVLPAPMPLSTVWGYGRDGDPLPGEGVSSFSYPGPTVEARSNQPVQVTWINGLVDNDGQYRPHLLPVDSTIHWANPGGTSHTGGHDHGTDQHDFYTGPVPIITHVHGAHSFDHSDGHPEAWFLPDARDIPSSFATVGQTFASQGDAGAGAAIFEYPLDEDAATLWYHDHTLGMTRVNIYAGLAGFWLIRDQLEDGLDLPGPPPRLGDLPGTPVYEIPLVIQDKTFGENGALWYPSSRAQYDDYTGPYIPDSDVPPIWGPEFIGNSIVVNGRTWPYLEVEPRLYRFRMLNASDARTLIVNFDRADIEFVQIGGDGGRQYNAPVRATQLVMGPAERFDVIVDFSKLGVGDTVTMLNVGPDDPWGGPDAGQDPADPSTTGQIMQFRVVPLTNAGNPGKIPTTLPPRETLTPNAPPRDLLLAELDADGEFPTHVLLGTVTLGPLLWTAPTTEVIKLNDTEIWRVANTTDDAHPIHIHLIDFQILDRIPFDVDAFTAAQSAFLAGTGPEPVLDTFINGPPIAISPSERAPKDTAIMMPGTITRLVARFDRAGSYVWHCHIIEHEDNEMMRPLEIVAP
jgi:FtsP/CotA-like multicopper oxidase with cupredoxin domain